MFVRTGTVALGVILGACSGSDMSSPPGERGPEVPVIRLRAEPYSFAFFSGLDRPARIVVREDATWQAVWTDIERGNSFVPAPTVDFTHEMVLVAAQGLQNSAGYGILIDGANEAENGGINVIVRSISPGNCMTAAVMTQPIDIARLPIRTGKVEFTERSEVHHC